MTSRSGTQTLQMRQIRELAQAKAAEHEQARIVVLAVGPLALALRVRGSLPATTAVRSLRRVIEGDSACASAAAAILVAPEPSADFLERAADVAAGQFGSDFDDDHMRAAVWRLREGVVLDVINALPNGIDLSILSRAPLDLTDDAGVMRRVFEPETAA